MADQFTLSQQLPHGRKFAAECREHLFEYPTDIGASVDEQAAADIVAVIAEGEDPGIAGAKGAVIRENTVRYIAIRFQITAHGESIRMLIGHQVEMVRGIDL